MFEVVTYPCTQLKQASTCYCHGTSSVLLNSTITSIYLKLI